MHKSSIDTSIFKQTHLVYTKFPRTPDRYENKAVARHDKILTPRRPISSSSPAVVAVRPLPVTPYQIWK